MKGRWLVGRAAGRFVVSLATPAAAAEGDKIVRTKGLDGLPVISIVCGCSGAQVLGSLDTLPGAAAAELAVPGARPGRTTRVNFLLSLLGLATIEPDLPVASLPEDALGDRRRRAPHVRRPALAAATPMAYYGTTAWQGYLEQPADGHRAAPRGALRPTARRAPASWPSSTPASTPSIPTLDAVLTAGYDFTRNIDGGERDAASARPRPRVVDGDVQLR